MRFIPIAVLLALVAVIAFADKNEIVGINDYTSQQDFYWHSDTDASGDEIVYADDYHWDTLSLPNPGTWERSDAYKNIPLTWKWGKYDGARLWLSVGRTTAGCSTRIAFLGGHNDSIYTFLLASKGTGQFDTLINFDTYFDNDSLCTWDLVGMKLIVGDTITNDEAEYDRRVRVRMQWKFEVD